MKYGFILTGNSNDLVELAQEAEAAGWDGVFLPIIIEGETPHDDVGRSAALVQPYAEAGATWWLESMWESAVPRPYDMRTRIRSGPPRVS